MTDTQQRHQTDPQLSAHTPRGGSTRQNGHLLTRIASEFLSAFLKRFGFLEVRR